MTATASEVEILETKDLDTLKADNLRWSEVNALSADGKIAGGNVQYGCGDHCAIIWSGDNYATKTDLDTLKADNSGSSWVNALSADGKIAGGSAGNDSGNSRAIIWSGDNWATKTDLGTLKTDNSGYSTALALSADGKIAGGSADNDSGNSRAIIWSGDNYATKTDLGTLKADNSGQSTVYTLSADGKIAGGSADNDSGNSRAIIWSGDNYATKTDLGTLKADNSGWSEVYALSADGKIAGGWAENANSYTRATIWSGANYATKTDLGTLKADNSGWSEVYALSADGKIAGGWAENANSYTRATIWSGANYATKTDLGTLKADNSGHSRVDELSADGKIAGGWAENASSYTRATLWRLDYPAKIDVANTVATIGNLGADSFSLMAMQSHALDRLQYICRVEQGFCFGVQDDFYYSKDNDNRRIRDIAIGVNAGYGFGNGVSLGVSLDHSVSRKLPDSYQHKGDDVGVGAVVRYQHQNGYFGELSGAYDDYTARISRPLLPNTELGVNEADIKGVSYGVKVGKQFGNAQNNYRAYVGATHRNISRDAYTENENTAFPISYGKMEYKDTTATIGVQSKIGLTPKLSWVSDVSAEYRLNNDKPIYTASLTGTEKYDFSYTAEPKRWRGQLATGLRYDVVPSTHIELMPYVGKNTDDQNYYGGLMRVETRF